MSDFPALQVANGPVGGTRIDGLGVGTGEAVEAPLGVAVGVGLVVSEGLGVGAADAGPASRATASKDEATTPAGILENLVTN